MGKMNEWCQDCKDCPRYLDDCDGDEEELEDEWNKRNTSKERMF